MAEPSRGRRAVERLFRVLAFLVLALVVLLIGAYLLRGPLFGRMLADRIELELGKALGGRFSVARVEGSYVFDLAVVGLRTEEAPPGVLVRLDCGRAVVEYDLKRLFDGDLGGISSVLASNAVVELDLTRPGGAPGAGEPEIPKHLPRLEIYGSVAVRTEMGEVRAEGVSVNTVGRDRLGVFAKELRLPERFGHAAPFAATVERTGPLAFVLASDSPVAGITPTRVAYDGDVDARVRIGESPAWLRMSGREARLESEALDLASLPAWAYPDGVERPEEALVRVDAHAVLRPLVVQARASAPRFRWRDLDVKDVAGEVRYENGLVLVRTAHAEGHGVLLDASDVTLDPALPWVVGDVGEATVRVGDLRAIEPRLDRPLALLVRARRAGAKGISIEEAKVEGEGILLEARGEVVPPDDPERWQEARISATYAGRVRDFTSGDYSLTGEVRLSGDVAGTIALPEASVRVEGDGLAAEGRRVDRLALDALVAPPQVRIRELRVEGEAGTVLGRGAIDLKARTLSDASYEIDVTDLAGFLKLFPGAPALDGTLSGRGSLSADESGLSGTAEVAASRIVSGDRELGSLALKVRANGHEIAVEEAKATGPWGTATARGSVRPDDTTATVDALEIRAGVLEADLNRPFRIGWSDEGAHAGPLDLTALGGRVRGTLALVDRERLEGSLHGDEIDLGILDPRLTGRAAVDAVISGDRYELDLSAPSASFEGRAGSARIKVRSDLDGIVVERLHVEVGDTITVEGSATLPWRFDGAGLERVETVESRLVLDARAQRLTIGSVAVGEASITARGEVRSFRSSVRMRDVSVGGFAVRGETLAEITATPGRFDVTAALERCDLGDAEGRVSADRGFDWTRPDEIRAALDAARVDGAIQLRAPDLGALRRLVPGLLDLSGAADGTVTVRGPLTAPAIEGRVHLAGVDAKATGRLPRFTDGSGDASFDGRVLRIDNLAGKLGYAPVGVSGTIDLRGGSPVLDLQITGENTLLVAERDLRVRADLDVSVAGPIESLRIGGTARIADALYTRPQSLLASGPATAEEQGPLFRIRDAPFGSATLDVRVTADETIRVRTPSIAGNLSCDLLLRGTGEAPAPEGRVFVRDLLVDLKPAAPFKVDRAEIRFPPGEPFDPRIDLTAHTRLKGYDLEVVLSGRVADTVLHVASRPALPQDEAILLLLTGYTTEELRREGISEAAFGKLASFLGARLVARISGPRDPDERTFLERFKFTVGKDVSRSGEDTIEAEFEASDRVFLRVERDRFDEYNGGVVWRIRFR